MLLSLACEATAVLPDPCEAVLLPPAGEAVAVLPDPSIAAPPMLDAAQAAFRAKQIDLQVARCICTSGQNHLKVVLLMHGFGIYLTLRLRSPLSFFPCFFF